MPKLATRSEMLERLEQCYATLRQHALEVESSQIREALCFALVCLEANRCMVRSIEHDFLNLIALGSSL